MQIMEIPALIFWILADFVLLRNYVIFLHIDVNLCKYHPMKTPNSDLLLKSLIDSYLNFFS